MPFLWVGIGGVVGALLRYQLSRWVSERLVVSFPLATLVINVSGSFLLGWLTRWLGVWLPSGLAPTAMLLLGTGLCGAYTTFSTFCYESVILLRERRLQTAAVYILTSLVIGLAASAIGLYGLPAGSESTH
ncbi:fluoride efflux transporter CrcB [Alicyclobacillus shizuokensis]|uniref:fluoride efflux transporter CrcB n=1 Tax=Alicyclobacillus shizuokensis TaxID=392014 RepID=UPI000835DA11|nr:fluoride efflux transporter CrcB [Alicyclobacillus shizuokensis]MCL6625672.1 fluoride efflux transporter CrcB [Alicyclobacillus shizuokensis]